MNKRKIWRRLFSFPFCLITVAPKPEDLSLTGIPDDYVEVSTDLELTCTLSRIKPEADEMYWIVGGLRGKWVTNSYNQR